MKAEKRSSTQFLMPVHKNGEFKSGYDIYPAMKLEEGENIN